MLEKFYYFAIQVHIIRCVLSVQYFLKWTLLNLFSENESQ